MKVDMALVRQIVRKHLSNPQSIILLVYNYLR